MEPHERKFVQITVRTSNLDTINDLLRRLVRKRIFPQEYVDQHREEILEIFEECRLDVGTSSSDSDDDGKKNHTLSTRRRAKVLDLYGPVDDRVSISIARHNKKHHLAIPSQQAFGTNWPCAAGDGRQHLALEAADRHLRFCNLET